MKIAVMFPGYGSQYVGMGKELYDEYRIVQEYFEEASNCIDINFVKLCFASSDAEISKLLNAYSSLFVIGCSIFALLKEQGITFDVVGGYNNGEFAALCSAGCFSLPDGLYLIQKMCTFFEDALTTMDVELLHVKGRTYQGLSDDCSKLSDGEHPLFIAIHNSDTDHIVVGSLDQIKKLHEHLEVIGGVILDYADSEIGLHSWLMQGVVEQLRSFLEKVDFKDVSLPVVSGLDGVLTTQGQLLKEQFLRYLYEPVNFVAVMETLAAYDMIMIIAPAAQLSERLKQQYPDKTIITIEKKSDIEAFKEVIQINI